jgi:hypothetical protein
MTATHWTNGISGSFELGSNWSTGTVPNPSGDGLTADAALIDATGTYTVTASLSHVVHDLSIVAGATLNITGGDFYIMGTGTNSGIINNYSHLLAATLNNVGTIESVSDQETSPNDQTIIYVDLASGAGSNAGNILATNDGSIETNGGRIWFGGFSEGGSFNPSQFSNTGLIEAFGKSLVQIDLVYDPVKGGISFTNSGWIEAIGQGALVVITAYDDTNTAINNGNHPFVNNGLLYVDDGDIEIDDSVTGSGSAIIANAGTLFLGEGVVFGQNITFAIGAHGKLEITPQASVTGTVAGFAAGDSIHLILYGTTTVTYSANIGNTSGTLGITDGIHSTTITLAGSYVASGFHVVNDGDGIPLITYAEPQPDHGPSITNKVFNSNPGSNQLSSGQIALEMVKLAIDAYPDAPIPGAFHTFNPLTTTGGIPQDSKAQQDIQADNWHAVSAGELGLNSLGQQGSLQYSLVNGYYQAYDTNDAFESDPSEGDALVLTGLVNGKMTLAVSFAGTDQVSDWLDYANFSTHYAKFDPLVSAIKNYIDSHQVDQVFVSGHSLGAAMAQYFMEDARFQNDPRFKAWTIGSPGADNVSSSSPDPRITNFKHQFDKVMLVPTVSNWTLNGLVEFLGDVGVGPPAGELAQLLLNGSLKVKFRQGEDIPVGPITDSIHDKQAYFDDIDALYGFPLLGPIHPTVIVTGSNRNLSGIISFSDPDLNDRPTATIDPVNQLVIGQDAFGTALSLSAAQIATFEKAFQISPEPGNTNTGKIDWSYSIPDKAIDFLSVGETVTVRTPVVIDDHQGGTTVQTELVTVKGGRNPSPPSGTTAEMIMSSPSNGDYEIYNVGGNRILAAYYLARVGSPWTFASLGTFQAGDSNDMLLRNASTGAFEAYYVGGNTITNTALVGTVGLDWNFAGIGNFDGASSLSELMLRNTFSGSFELYQVAGGGVLSGSSVAPVGNNFQVKGFGKFSGSAETQMIMQDNTFDVFRGQLELYTYQPDTASLAGINVGKVGSNLSIVGCADLLGNGETQMVMQQDNGNFWLYTYNPTSNALSGTLVGVIGSNFHVVGFGQLGTAGQDEMLMQDAAGNFEVYQYNAGLNAFVGNPMGAVGAPWIVDGIAGNPPGAAGTSTAQLAQAMAGFGDGGGSGAADSLNTFALGADTSQQLLTTPQHA